MSRRLSTQVLCNFHDLPSLEGADAYTIEATVATHGVLPGVHVELSPEQFKHCFSPILKMVCECVRFA